jgi:Rod binding domain-containing protein
MTSPVSTVGSFDMAALSTQLRERVSANRANGAERQGSDSNVGVQFEAMVLRQVLEDMLPKDASSVFGEGTAGNVWRSMLAENLANAMASRNILGLAETVAPPVHVEGKKTAE